MSFTDDIMTGFGTGFLAFYLSYLSSIWAGSNMWI